MMKQQWRRLTGEKITRPIKQEIEMVIRKERQAGHVLKVCIGTDSQVKGKITEFATVIVFVRQGKGGFMYIHHEHSRQVMTVKQRMLLEVARSIEVAYELCELFSKYEVAMEVHVDINTSPNFKSHDALNEAMGYILSMGYIFKAKPLAFASSSCANKAVR